MTSRTGTGKNALACYGVSATAWARTRTIIQEALDERDNKLDYMRYLRRWANDQSLSLHATHELQNVIRSFFINNGARVLTKPYPDVYGSKKS